MSEGAFGSEPEDQAGGPAAISRRWIEAVMEDADWEAAWSLSDPVLRLAHVQAWLWPLRAEEGIEADDLEDLAAELCAEGPVHPLWDEFATAAVGTYHRTWQEFDLSRWTVRGSASPVAPDLEVVVYVRRAEAPIVTTEDLLVARPFLMRFTPDGWLVAHAGGDRPPVPGWPPEFPTPSGDG